MSNGFEVEGLASLEPSSWRRAAINYKASTPCAANSQFMKT